MDISGLLECNAPLSRPSGRSRVIERLSICCSKDGGRESNKEMSLHISSFQVSVVLWIVWLFDIQLKIMRRKKGEAKTSAVQKMRLASQFATGDARLIEDWFIQTHNTPTSFSSTTWHDCHPLFAWKLVSRDLSYQYCISSNRKWQDASDNYCNCLLLLL